MELLKSFIKILIIVWMAYSYIKDRTEYLFLLYDMEILPAKNKIKSKLKIKIKTIE